jgi:quinoprotein dehydrogenase-associated probable ABC transporter substrate-binding protein
MTLRISAAFFLLVLSGVAAQAGALRVCADPNNMPFSNRAGQGFENRIAALVARDLGDTVTYTFAAEHEAFVKHTLDAGKCDVVMGVPVGYDEVDETQPYYASTYVFVSRRNDRVSVSTLTDPRLRKLRIGVHLLAGDDQPPEIALGEEGIVDNVSGFMINGDRSRPDPAARLIEAVANKEVDVAAAWGPLAGYYAKRSPVPLTVVPITGTERFAPLRFRFAIAMGVRKGDDALRRKLDAILVQDRRAITAILRSYGVPLLETKGEVDG